MFEMSVIPPVRISTLGKAHARLHAAEAGHCAVYACQNGEETLVAEASLPAAQMVEAELALDTCRGTVTLAFRYAAASGETKEISYPYEVVDTGVPSTTLLDGCWVDIYHWSEAEGRPFNAALKELTDADWREQIRAMSEVGIRGAVIQDVFHLDEYVGKHKLTLENYNGLAFYPSKLYPGRCPVASQDPIETILSAGDEYGVQVAVGIGLFAWFDFGETSLAWHKRVAAEVWQRYGHHPSFYGFYVSEEVAGSLYFEDFHPHTRPEQWREIEHFFREFRTYCSTLAPTKPVLFACNNIHFERYPEAWKAILAHIDILLVFAFARDYEHLNVKEIKDICDAAGTHFFVDLEVFQYPFDKTGLIPKDIDELIQEIRVYDIAQQIYGYEYTGHLNHPGGPEGLGGPSAKALYSAYQKYAQGVLQAKQNGEEA